jgi:hypothetical protein
VSVVNATLNATLPLSFIFPVSSSLLFFCGVTATNLSNLTSTFSLLALRRAALFAHHLAQCRVDCFRRFEKDSGTSNLTDI